MAATIKFFYITLIMIGLFFTLLWAVSCEPTGSSMPPTADGNADGDADGDSDSDADADSDGDTDSDGDGDTDGDADSESDADSEIDTGIDTFAPIDTDEWENNDFEPLCTNFCDQLINCDVKSANGKPYSTLFTWFTGDDSCIKDCTADFNEAKASIITECENATFVNYTCEMKLSCEDLIVQVAGRGDFSELPCGAESKQLIDICY